MSLAEDKEIQYNEEKEDSDVELKYVKQKINEMRKILKIRKNYKKNEETSFSS